MVPVVEAWGVFVTKVWERASRRNAANKEQF